MKKIVLRKIFESGKSELFHVLPPSEVVSILVPKYAGGVLSNSNERANPLWSFKKYNEWIELLTPVL